MTTLHVVHGPAAEHKFTGTEPTWIDTPLDTSRYTIELLKALSWHTYCAQDSDYRKYLEEWFKEKRPKTAKDDTAQWRKVGDKDINKSIATLARISLQGFALNDDHAQLVIDYVQQVTKKEKKVKETKIASTKPTVSIQDRIKAQVSVVLGDVDALVDQALTGSPMPTVEDLHAAILTKGFKGPQLKLVSAYLSKNIVEWQAAYDKEDEQLVEGYSFIKRPALKKVITVFSAALDSVSKHHTKIKAQRIVKKKPQDKKKLASKIKYLVEDTKLGIKSQSPVGIIGANSVWVYDTKKRLLGYYEAETSGGLFIRGTMIDGFKTTCVKILRKPDEQLEDFRALRKNQTVNWINDIKAKCKTLAGRMNAHTLIVRID